MDNSDKIETIEPEPEPETIVYQEPYENSFTIYSKSGCKFCSEVKKLLKNKNIFFQVINCDDYLLENKEDFLEYIKKQTNSPIKTFPIVFNDKKQFIGGYIETEKYLEKKLSFDDIF